MFVHYPFRRLHLHFRNVCVYKGMDRQTLRRMSLLTPLVKLLVEAYRSHAIPAPFTC